MWACFWQETGHGSRLQRLHPTPANVGVPSLLRTPSAACVCRIYRTKSSSRIYRTKSDAFHTSCRLTFRCMGRRGGILCAWTWYTSAQSSTSTSSPSGYRTRGKMIKKKQRPLPREAEVGCTGFFQVVNYICLTFHLREGSPWSLVLFAALVWVSLQDCACLIHILQS